MKKFSAPILAMALLAGLGTAMSEALAQATDVQCAQCVGTGDIAFGAVREGRIADGAVTNRKIALGAVPEGRIANKAVTTPKIALGAVVEGRLANGAVTTNKIRNGAVTTAKIATGALTEEKFEQDFFDSLLEYASGRRLVFATSLTFTGDLVTEAANLGLTAIDGIDVGDRICQHLADTNLNPPVLGTFRAWLSDSSVDARDRLNNAVDYHRFDGVEVSYSKTDLISNVPLLMPLRIDELGQNISTTIRVWTNTNGDGISLNTSCNNWTSASSGVDGWEGQSTSTAGWTALVNGDTGCSILHRLYCFQQ